LESLFTHGLAPVKRSLPFFPVFFTRKSFSVEFVSFPTQNPQLSNSDINTSTYDLWKKKYSLGFSTHQHTLRVIHVQAGVPAPNCAIKPQLRGAQWLLIFVLTVI
jgi:hypothetical protein